MEENIFRKLLEERGWHLTKQRNAILQKAFSYKGHFGRYKRQLMSHKMAKLATI